VLVVDDSATFRYELAEALREQGCDTVLAASGEEALELLELQPVDAILMDVLMPGLSGYEACRRIKANDSWKEIPLLMLTSLDERQAMLEGIEAGADDYIPKSPDFEVLKARLRAQMRRRQYEDENRRVRRELLARELEAAEARAAQRVAETRAALTSELERKNKELESFSYSVSHDLRAPLRSIRGFSELLLAEAAELNPSVRDYLGRIAAAGERMGQLIDDLLALSRIGRHDLVRQSVNVTRLAREVGEQLAQQQPQRAVDFVVADGLEADADPRLLRVVFENLLGNAWKFTGRASLARVTVGREGGAEPAFFVRDNGAGFDMAQAERLFAPFQRLHTVADFPGTGIGLATVYRIIDRHAGRIWAESAPGEGAVFRFSLGGTAV
jgi:signal transduction histidine kinase